LISEKDFGTSGECLTIEDEGGLDILDFSRFYKASDFTTVEGNDYDGDGKDNDTLLDNGPRSNDIIIFDDGDEGQIETILFTDGPMIRAT